MGFGSAFDEGLNLYSAQSVLFCIRLSPPDFCIAVLARKVQLIGTWPLPCIYPPLEAHRNRGPGTIGGLLLENRENL